MARIYAITKTTNLYSDNIATSILNHYFDTLEDAQRFLYEFADDEFGCESFYKLISDNGEVYRSETDYTEGIQLTVNGIKKAVEYGIITLRSYNKES